MVKEGFNYKYLYTSIITPLLTIRNVKNCFRMPLNTISLMTRQGPASSLNTNDLRSFNKQLNKLKKTENKINLKLKYKSLTFESRCNQL